MNIYTRPARENRYVTDKIAALKVSTCGGLNVAGNDCNIVM